MKNLSLVFRSLALPVLLLTLNAAGAQEKQPLRYVCLLYTSRCV